MRHLTSYTLIAIVFVLHTKSAHADLDTINLPGTTQTDLWTNINSTNNPGFPGFPGFGAWPNAIGSNGPGSGDAELVKTANGAGGAPFPASSAIYFGGISSQPNTFGGELSFTDQTPVAGLANVVFQVEVGGAFGHDFFNDALPVLNYTSSAGAFTNITAQSWAITDQEDTGSTFTDPNTGQEIPIYINTYRLQWDLSQAASEIDSFDLRYQGVQHSQLYSARLDQSDVFVNVTAVPEPTHAALLLVLTGCVVWCVKRCRLVWSRCRAHAIVPATQQEALHHEG